MSGALGRLIRARRREMGLTQEEFAELLGEEMRQSEISRLERGHVSQPRPERLQRIAEVLDIPVGELLLQTAWAEQEPDEAVPAHAESGAALSTPAQRSPMDEAMESAQATIKQTRRILESLGGEDDLAPRTSD